MFQRQAVGIKRLFNQSTLTRSSSVITRNFTLLTPKISIKPNNYRNTINGGANKFNTSFKRFISDEMKQSITDAVNSAPVVLFMKGTPEAPACGFSRATINLLGNIGVDPNKFAAYNVLEDAELRQSIKEYSDWPTIPQLYVNGEFVGGCDIVTSMAQSGELLELLEKDGLLAYEEEEAELEEPSSSNIKPAKRD